jgi:hypothetical protein
LRRTSVKGGRDKRKQKVRRERSGKEAIILRLPQRKESETGETEERGRKTQKTIKVERGDNEDTGPGKRKRGHSPRT